MHFAQTLRYFQNNNACDITYMAVLIFLENLDFKQIAQTSKCLFSDRLLIAPPLYFIKKIECTLNPV